ncbi:MAG: Hpt domain-containing protein, partial [Pseudomonadota bacterium]
MSKDPQTTLKPSKAVQLARLRARYGDSLPSKIEEIQSLWAAYQSGISAETLQAFHMAVHRLRGSSGSYGYMDIHAAATKLEELLIHTGIERGVLSGSVAERLATAV